MANNVSGRKCPNCGSALRYDPESSRLICDFCDSGFTIEEVDAADREQAQQVGSMNFTAGNEALQNLTGDAFPDGKITSKDSTAIKQVVLGTRTLEW